MQYRDRVTGKEPNNAYAVAHLYHEPLLVQEESARRLDVGIGGRMDGSYRHACSGDCLQDGALTGTAAGDVCAHHFDGGSGALLRGMRADLIALTVEGGSAVSCPGLSGAG